jgi:hypothetical protein
MWRKECIKSVAKTGWLARLKDGTSVAEHDGIPWSKIKDSVTLLSIVSAGKTLVSLPKDQKRYIQGKTGSCGITGGEIRIEYRWIGFESESGEVVKASISERTGEVFLTASKGA